MKKQLRFLSLILAVLIFGSIAGKSQFLEIEHTSNPSPQTGDAVIIGTATTTNHNTPVYPWYGYSMSQTLYFQSELNFENKLIEAIGYQYAGSSTTLDLTIEIYFEHTSLTELTQTVQLGTATKVFDGSFVFSSTEQWSSVTINSFFYNNTDNLLVTVIEKKPGWNSSADVFYSTATLAGNAWCRGVWNDGAAYDPQNLPATSQISFRANTKLWITDVPEGPPVSQITPNTLNFGDVETSKSKSLFVEIKNAGADPLEITGYMTSDDQFNVANTTFPFSLGAGEKRNVEIAFAPYSTNQQNGVITFVMEDGIEGDREVQVTGNGVFFLYIIVGEGTYESSNTPIYPWYGYSYTQTLYKQSEIETPNALIQRIGYQYAGTSTNLDFIIEIWLAHTTINSITGSIPLSGSTKVYDGPYIVNAGEEFSSVEIEPFLYNNEDNLLITVIEKKPGWNSSADKFLATEVPAGENLCIGDWNDGSPYNPDNLTTGYEIAYRANVKLWISGELPTEPEARTTPESLYFGEVEATVAKVMNVEVMNKGGGVLEIKGADITNAHFSLLNVEFPVLLNLGQKKVFDVQFMPTDPGLEEGVLTFMMDDEVPGSKTVDLSGRGLRFGVLREGFENAMFPPLGWKVIDNNKDNKGWLRNTNLVPTGQIAPRTGVAAAGLDVYAGNWGQTAYDDWLITPKMVWQNGDIFNFWIKRLANQSGQIWRVQLSTTGNNVSDFTAIDQIIDPSMNYTEKSYDLSNYGLTHGTEFYMAFQFNGLWSWPGVIDDVLGSVMVRFDHDLMVLDFEGPDILFQNQEGNYEVKIANWGFDNVAGEDYHVGIFALIGGVETELASVPGQQLASGEVVNFNLPASIAQTGIFEVFAKIIFEQDEDLSNNSSKTKTTDVVPQSFVVKNIGDFPMTSQTPYYYNYPINFEDYRRTSLSQTLYFKTELNTGGLIDRIGYYRSFGQSMNERKIKVWMTEVSNANLTGTYIPPSEMTLVFEGNVNFPDGIGRSDILLTNPFVYTGSGNLLVTVYYFWGQSFNSTSKFAYKYLDWGPDRTIYEYGFQQIDPENPSQYLGRTPNYPNTTLMFETGNGLGNLSGRVMLQAGKSAVQGATISIENPVFPGAVAQLYSDAAGYFTAPYAMAGSNLKITVSKYGFVDTVLEGVNLPPGGSLNLGNIYLIESPQVKLAGNVIKSDTQTAAEDAYVKLFGMDNYETITDENGNFEFPSIWGLVSFEIEISLGGYQNYKAVINVPGEDSSLGTITLLENAPVPNFVTVEEIGDYAVLNWFGAGDPYPATFRYDDGTAVGVLITTGNPAFVGGSAWKHDAIVNSVHWYTFQSQSYPASDYVQLTILGLTEDGKPDISNILFIQGNVRNDYGWNTFDLAEPVYAPSGFFFGTSGYNNYTLIAYDDGVGEPYEFKPRRQWSNGMGSYLPLEEVTSPPLFGNIFIRASGFTFGELVPDMKNGEFGFLELAHHTSPIVTKSVEPIATGNPNQIPAQYKSGKNKALMHYNIFRKPVDDYDWVKVNHAPVTDTTFTDFGWTAVDLGIYHYGVVAEYSNGVLSEMAESNELGKTFVDGQIVDLKKGWSAISTYQVLNNPALHDVFKYLTEHQLIEIMLGKTGIYWPGYNINTIGNWNTYEGYKIKMNSDQAVLMKGQMAENKTIQLPQGVSYLPVLSETPIDAKVFFNQISNQIFFAFDIVNGLVYWPAGGLTTLEVLEPGKGYLISMHTPASVVFPAKSPSYQANAQAINIKNSPWEVLNTGIAHIVSVSPEALQTFEVGDIIGAFNSKGTCVGVAQIVDKNANLSLIIFGNDFTTPQIDGMMEGEIMTFRSYSIVSQTASAIEPVWDLSKPNNGSYTDFGMSAISFFKMESTGATLQSPAQISIYPNPATREVFVMMNNNIPTTLKILNNLGAVQMIIPNVESQIRIDVGNLTPGIYMLRIMQNNTISTHKLIIR